MKIITCQVMRLNPLNPAVYLKPALSANQLSLICNQPYGPGFIAIYVFTKNSSTSMSKSSSSLSPASGTPPVSPGFYLTAGNSHLPARFWPCARCAISTFPSFRIIAAITVVIRHASFFRNILSHIDINDSNHDNR